MKDVVIIVLITIGVFAFGIWMVSIRAEQAENYCRADCATNGGEYVRSDGYSSYKDDMCICKVNNEVKNIW